MKLKPKHKLAEHFDEIEDPRVERTKRHKLIDILTIAGGTATQPPFDSDILTGHNFTP